LPLDYHDDGEEERSSRHRQPTSKVSWTQVLPTALFDWLTDWLRWKIDWVNESTHA
jgi:hypothetical protein